MIRGLEEIVLEYRFVLPRMDCAMNSQQVELRRIACATTLGSGSKQVSHRTFRGTVNATKFRAEEELGAALLARARSQLVTVASAWDTRALSLRAPERLRIQRDAATGCSGTDQSAGPIQRQSVGDRQEWAEYFVLRGLGATGLVDAHNCTCRQVLEIGQRIL